jgi:hypothetical protein
VYEVAAWLSVKIDISEENIVSIFKVKIGTKCPLNVGSYKEPHDVFMPQKPAFSSFNPFMLASLSRLLF